MFFRNQRRYDGCGLLDLGADEEVLKRALGSIPVEGFEVQIGRVHRAGLEVCDFAVKLDQAHENHDHDMEYLHGHSEHRAEEREHILESQITQHKHVHVHRGLQEILHIIEHADAAQGAKELAKKIFRILAEAEAEAHGVSVEEVYFHEVGAVDSIVDILAVAVCLENLQIEEVIVPELYEGRGCIRCQHGILPVPVPAVVHIVQRHGIVLHLTKTEGELVTPTGAAIAAAVATSQSLPEHFIIQKVGLGAGKREYDAPGILRAMLIEEVADAEIKREKTAEQADVMYMLETNIDDCSGEQLGAVMEQLLEGGAADVFYTPVFMKKNRPATPCLATRFPYDTPLSYEEMKQVEVDENYFEKIIKMRKEIISFLKDAGSAYVTIDLEGFRSGSMDLFL